MRSKSYNDGVTSNVSYLYNADWLTSVTVNGGTVDSMSYENLGRVTSSTQTTNGGAYTFQYSYNLADSVMSVTMPSGRVVSTAYNTANQPTSLTGVLGTVTTPYASSITYAPQGAVSGMALGNGLAASNSFNSRLQMTGMNLGTSSGGSNIWSLANGYGTTANNGNVTGQTLTFSISATTSATVGSVYTYDGVNRLSIGAENSSNPSNPACPDSASQWCRQYSYYPVGNGNRKTLNFSGQGLSPLEPGGFNANNQITGSGWTYDGRGNVTQEPTGATSTYDAENRQLTYCISGTCTTYTYDGGGRRVMTQGSGNVTVFVYDVAGNLAAEYPSQAPSTNCTTCYVTTDHLGSTRVVTDNNGCAVFRQDYLPFGEEILTSTGNPRYSATGGTICTTNGYVASASPARGQFAGKERDAESGLDFFGARYMSSAQGRFTSPDEPFNNQDTGNPQSWNLYSYVGNNPLAFTDPDGRTTCDANGDNCYDSVTVNGGSTDSVPYFWSVLNSFGGQAAQTAVNITDTALTAISNFRNNSNCATALTLGGAAAGAGIGAYVGGGAGGAAGLVAGSVVPVAGNAAGLVGGAALGSTGGALAGGSMGGALGALAGNVFCSSSAGGSGGGGGTSGGSGSKWNPGGHKSAQKWANQMAKRGWTPQQIDEAIEHGQQFAAPNNVNPANGATRYVNPTTGRSVVLDNVTGELLHVGGNGFRY